MEGAVSWRRKRGKEKKVVKNWFYFLLMVMGLLFVELR